MIEDPTIVDAEEQRAAVIHITISRLDMPKVMPPALQELLAAIEKQGMMPQGPMFTHHLKLSSETFDFEVGFPIAGEFKQDGRVKPGTLPSTKVARTVYTGPYEGLYGAWDTFGKKLEAEGLLDKCGFKGGDTLWESYLLGPESGDDASKYRTELNLPLIKA